MESKLTNIEQGLIYVKNNIQSDIMCGDCNECPPTKKTGCLFNEYRQGYILGEQSKQEELTRWNDPKEPPKHAKQILLKLKDRHFENIFYSVGTFYDGVFNHQFQFQYADIIGWRDIHE